MSSPNSALTASSVVTPRDFHGADNGSVRTSETGRSSFSEAQGREDDDLSSKNGKSVFPLIDPDADNIFQLSLRAKDLNVNGNIAAVVCNDDNSFCEETELVLNTSNPVWTDLWTFSYSEKDKMKALTITLLDSRKKREKKVLGSCVVRISKLIKEGRCIGVLQGGEVEELTWGGCVVATLEKKKHSKTGVFSFQFRGIKLKNIENGFFGKSDPFYEILRKSERSYAQSEDDWVLIFRSDVISDHLNPIWKKVHIDLSKICNGNLERAFKIVIYDHESDGKHDIMGEFVTSVKEIVDKFSSDKAHLFPLTLNKVSTGSIHVSKVHLWYEFNDEKGEELRTTDENEKVKDSHISNERSIGYVQAGPKLGKIFGVLILVAISILIQYVLFSRYSPNVSFDVFDEMVKKWQSFLHLAVNSLHTVPDAIQYAHEAISRKLGIRLGLV
eukprot:CAMPEP_0194276108 /NCGR_PEP_ID=MMETSP0169-20130528/8780_1 /TAXON_ID=218684 /ORGANISM="Corethron pennatum, Strain L29A3" /LENGTH=442 /DNA_ID=CAMNT_0039019739 /DNA_START=421 /DNA_END=1749 /DNA_ORIENTATION=-